MALSGCLDSIRASDKNVTTFEPCACEIAFTVCAGKNKSEILRQWIVCVLVVLISGCSITQDYQRPHVDVPDKWRVDYQTAVDISDSAWWEQFQDQTLNEMIKTALTENKDLRIATARIEEFIGKLRAIRADFFPQLNYGVLGSRNNQSSSRPTPELFGSSSSESDAYRTTIAASWELDIWGRIRRESEAGRADLLSAEEGRRAVVLELVSAVVQSYIKLLCMDKQLQYYKDTLNSRKESVALFEKKSIGGLVAGLDLAQISGGYMQVAELIPDMECQIAKMENALSVLLGRNPGTVKRGKTFDDLVMPEVPQGIPSDILVRRPDIRQCEQNLIAANARIGVARTRYFPTISLTGLFGYSSIDITNLLSSASNLWQAGAAALGPVFDGGRIKGEIYQYEARRQQLLNAYVFSIQNAFREVNDALMSVQKIRELLKIQEEHISILNNNVHFARTRYESKLASSYFEVMDAERNLFFVESNYLATRNRLFDAMVSMYKVMGGGWIADAERLIPSFGQKTESSNQSPPEYCPADTIEEGIFR